MGLRTQWGVEMDDIYVDRHWVKLKTIKKLLSIGDHYFVESSKIGCHHFGEVAARRPEKDSKRYPQDARTHMVTELIRGMEWGEGGCHTSSNNMELLARIVPLGR